MHRKAFFLVTHLRRCRTEYLSDLYLVRLCTCKSPIIFMKTFQLLFDGLANSVKRRHRLEPIPTRSRGYQHRPSQGHRAVR